LLNGTIVFSRSFFHFTLNQDSS